MTEPLDVVLKRFDSPDETRHFSKGRFDLIHIGGMTIGRATYEPGWKWSVNVGAALGQQLCQVEHVGQVLSGSATASIFLSFMQLRMKSSSAISAARTANQIAVSR